MLTHTEVIGGNTKQSLYLATGHQTLGKNDFGALEIAKDPRSVCRLYEFDMRLNELIEVYCASVTFAQLRNRARRADANDPANKIIRRSLSVAERPPCLDKTEFTPDLFRASASERSVLAARSHLDRPFCADLDSDRAPCIAVHCASDRSAR